MLSEKLKKLEKKVKVVNDILDGEKGLAGLKEHYEWSQNWHENNGDADTVMEYAEMIDILNECLPIIEEALEKYLVESVVK